MKEYQVISHMTPPEFHKLISQALSEGWQLVGGVSSLLIPKNDGNYQVFYSQALAR